MRKQADESMMMSRGFAKIAKLAPSLAPLLKDSSEKFESLAKEASVAAADLAKAASKPNRDAVRKHRRTIMTSCKSCHSLGTGADPGFNSLARSAQERLGIGNGFCAFGHDVRIRHADRDRAQQALDALRVGALLIDAHLSHAEDARK